jgi:RNA polymerase sigma factor (sigma-70 family)
MVSQQTLTTDSLWHEYRASGATEARNELVMRYAPDFTSTINWIASTTPLSVSRDEIESAAYVGLIGAVERFNPDDGVAFNTFAYQRVCGAVKDWMRQMDQGATRTRRYANVSTINGIEPFLHDDNDTQRATAISLFWEKAKRGLSDIQAAVVDMYYRFDHTQTVIGKALSISESRVGQIRHEAIKHMRSRLGDSFATELCYV